MKKILSTLLITVALSITQLAQAHDFDHREHRHDHGGWVAPLIIGGIIGGAIAEATDPYRTFVYPETPPAPVYHNITVASYYDNLRGWCHVDDVYDQYNRYYGRQTVCYGH